MNRLGDLKTYLPFAKNSFQQLISYKANVIMFMFGDGLMLAVTYSMIFLGKINGNNIISSLALQMLWIIILFIISKWMWKKLIKSLTILGG